MPFFRPERALARLLRHDPFSPFSHSPFQSPLSLTRFFDHHTPFAAPLYTVYEEPRDTSHQHNHHLLNHNTDKKEHSSPNSSKANNGQRQVSRSEREDGMERRHRRHGGRHHLSPFHNSFFSSPFPSLFNSSFPFSPFTPSLPSMPDMALDMFSTPHSYTIHAAVPGLDKKDIRITVDDGVLTIEAERREGRAAQPPASTTTSASASSTTSPQTSEAKAQETAAAESNATATAQSTQATESSQSTQPATTSSSSSTSPAESSQEDDGLSVHHVESFYGRVERSVQLPDDARADELTAKYEDGVIKIEIPRQHEQKKQAKRIEIQ